MAHQIQVECFSVQSSMLSNFIAPTLNIKL
jgi:hypothetical protein